MSRPRLLMASFALGPILTVDGFLGCSEGDADAACFGADPAPRAVEVRGSDALPATLLFEQATADATRAD